MPAFRSIALATLVIAASAALPALSAERRFELPPFHAVDIGTGIDASVTFAETQSVDAQARDERHLDHLELDVRDGVLRARIERNFLDFILEGGIVGQIIRGGDTGISLAIAVPQLDAATARSGASLTVSDVPSGSGFEAEASSGADMTLDGVDAGEVSLSAASGASIAASGECTGIRARASSGAHIDAQALQCTDATANASSGGAIAVTATTRIDANASSGGGVSVSGGPETIDYRESSGGSVTVR